jgi:hypothetical protein
VISEGYAPLLFPHDLTLEYPFFSVQAASHHAHLSLGRPSLTVKSSLDLDMEDVLDDVDDDSGSDWNWENYINIESGHPVKSSLDLDMEDILDDVDDDSGSDWN